MSGSDGGRITSPGIALDGLRYRIYVEPEESEGRAWERLAALSGTASVRGLRRSLASTEVSGSLAQLRTVDFLPTSTPLRTLVDAPDAGHKTLKPAVRGCVEVSDKGLREQFEVFVPTEDDRRLALDPRDRWRMFFVFLIALVCGAASLGVVMLM